MGWRRGGREGGGGRGRGYVPCRLCIGSLCAGCVFCTLCLCSRCGGFWEPGVLNFLRQDFSCLKRKDRGGGGGGGGGG